MAEKNFKTLTKDDIEEILGTYSIRKKEFKPYLSSYVNVYIEGYMITIEEEVDQFDGKLTGRYLVHHTQGNGKISFVDSWCKDKKGNLLFLSRNLSNEPMSDFEVYKDMERKIEICKKAFQEALEAQFPSSEGNPEQRIAVLEKDVLFWQNYANQINYDYQKLVNDRDRTFEQSPLYQRMLSKIGILELNEDVLNGRIRELTKENRELKSNSEADNRERVHNARKAGRKIHDKSWQKSLMQFEQLYTEGYSREEIMMKMNISQPTYYRYKKATEQQSMK